MTLLQGIHRLTSQIQSEIRTINPRVQDYSYYQTKTARIQSWMEDLQNKINAYNAHPWADSIAAVNHKHEIEKQAIHRRFKGIKLVLMPKFPPIPQYLK